MLETLYITKSKIRRDLLALFFTNPLQKYYLRELERLTGHSAGSIRRELLKFQKDGLFLTQKVGREINPTIYSWKDYQAKKKAKSGFIMEIEKNPKIMLIGRENDL
jgi:2-polyprenyl-3-methyl-5-hydroxy-6-metoxy-1,4-benzoquinol methylase